VRRGIECLDMSMSLLGHLQHQHCLEAEPKSLGIQRSISWPSITSSIDLASKADQHVFITPFPSTSPSSLGFHRPETDPSHVQPRDRDHGDYIPLGDVDAIITIPAETMYV
jgi:hypothetical protein